MIEARAPADRSSKTEVSTTDTRGTITHSSFWVNPMEIDRVPLPAIGSCETHVRRSPCLIGSTLVQFRLAWGLHLLMSYSSRVKCRHSYYGRRQHRSSAPLTATCDGMSSMSAGTISAPVSRLIRPIWNPESKMAVWISSRLD